MDPFKTEGLTKEKLETVESIVSIMKRLGRGNGYKKDATVSKVKEEMLKQDILAEANTIEQIIKLEKPDVSILAVLEVARRLRKEYEELSRERLPAMLDEVGMAKIELTSGEKIMVNDKLEASISERNYIQARNNMILGMVKTEDVDMATATEIVDEKFKKSLVISEPTEEVKQVLLDNDIPYDNKFTIHWQTLRKYCEQQLAKGLSIPEGINVFQYREATIK